MTDMTATATAIPSPSAGTLLRRAREAAGLHVAALAVALKVPVRKLEALEDDRFDLLPDAVFARALASSVCRTLKIDPQAVLERLPQSSAPRLIQDREGINAPFRAPGDATGPTWRDQITKPVFLTVAALLMGALILLLLPLAQREGAATAPGLPPGAAVEPSAVPQAAVQNVPVVTQADAVASDAASVPSNSAATVATTVTGGAVPQALPAANEPTVSMAEPVSGLIVFRATGPSWVEVTDARGGVALRRLLAAGESAGASGALPLSVTVGSAASTEVQVRGKPFDLARLARDNVARFEVK